MSYSFNWKGISMPKFMMLESVPSPLKFEQVTSVIDMPNSVPLVYQSQGFKAQTLSLSIGFRPGVWDSQFFKDYSGRTQYKNRTVEQLDIIFSAASEAEISNLQYISAYNWLSGIDKLTFSNDSSRYYNAVCNSQVVPERVSRRIRKLPVQFTIMPFRYSTTNSYEELTLTSFNTASNKSVISYSGTYPSEPTLRIWCTGNFAMDFGGNMSGYIKFTDITDYVVVDVPTRRVYDKDGNIILTKVEGDFTSLRLYDDLELYIDKNVTKVEIKKNTRWI